MSQKVSEWLESLGLGQYAAAFEENDIDWGLLGDIDQETLKDIGVISAGHRLQILKAAKSLGPEKTTPVPATLDATEVPPSEAVTHAKGDEDTSTWSRTPGERKPVTILFADIVGSTALTEKLDAEDAHDRLYQAIQCMCKAVENYNGTVCRFMGDGIMAMFGAPISSERHALEACCAALDIQSDIDKYAAELEATHGASLQVRVGLHSGEVVVLEVGDSPENPEYDASGPTVPLAARMEQTATAGTILITQETRDLAGELIQTSEQPAVKVKGVSEPVVVYQLEKVLSASESPVVANRHPIIGRQSELAQFRSLLETCLESSHGQTVFVRGEAGIGKTRLVEEMAHLAKERGFTSHRALVLDFGAGKGQGAIPSLVRDLLGIKQGSGKHERETALNQAESKGLVDLDHRVFMNDLLDLTQPLELRTIYDVMDVQARKEGKRSALVGLLKRLAARHSVFIVVEDLHWADSITLDYLARLTSAIAECPALMVLTSRAEGDPIDMTWRASLGEASIVTLDLGPLRKEESIKLVSAFIDASDSLAKRCVERAAGNPLFLEQLLLGVEKGADETVPDSIKSLVLSRMDQLPGEDKKALQAAAVLGQRFDLNGLRFLINKSNYECQNLVERHLLRPEGSLYLFAHALIQEGAYGSILKNLRYDLHRKAADYFVDRDLVLHAKHLEKARDDKAPVAFLNAANSETSSYRFDSALSLVENGIELITMKADLYSLSCLQGDLQSRSGKLRESVIAYKKAFECAENPAQKCRARIGLAHGLILLDEYDNSLQVLEQAEEEASRNSLNEDLAEIYRHRGNLYFLTGETDACHQQHFKAYQLAEELQSPKLMAQALSGLGDAAIMASRYLSAYKYFDQCVDLCEANNFSDIYAINLKMRADTKLYLNDRQGAMEDIQKVIEFSNKVGDLKAGAFANHTGAEIELGRGKIEAARGHLSEARKLFDKLGAKHYRVNNFIFWARLLTAEGNRDDALVTLEKGNAISQDMDSDWMRSWLLGQLALTTLDSDVRTNAMNDGERLIAEGSQDYIRDYFFRDGIDAALLENDWERVDRYTAEIEKSTAGESVPLMDFYVARGRALAKFGRGSMDDDTIRELKQLLDQAEQVGLQDAIPALSSALESIKP